MIPPFEVLDRRTAVHRHYLLEASAGTGKTFSIQHVVARLLIECDGAEEPPSIEKILVVTFTRAAVRDLKSRIRATLEGAVRYLKEGESIARGSAYPNPLHNGELDSANAPFPGVESRERSLKFTTDSSTCLGIMPDYLKESVEKGGAALENACKRLRQALFSFDQAQIMTIHAFCARTLRQFAMESDMGLHALSGEEPLPHSEIMGVIRDFMRTEVDSERYAPAQLAIVLARDPEQKKLLKLMQSGHDFPDFPPFCELSRCMAEQLQRLKGLYAFRAEWLVEDFLLQAGAYRNHKGAASKAATRAAVMRFASLLECPAWGPEEAGELIREGLIWVRALDPALLKGKPPADASLHYPGLTRELAESLDPLVEEARSFPVLLARMAADCRRLLDRYQREEEKFSPDDILRKMYEALDNPRLVAQVQANYRAAIIDEFQDTDPLQWQIFRRLFLPDSPVWGGYLYLVGDPKQSIYSFRQADIYTYLNAAQTLGSAHRFSLAVNYRSQPALVRALNALFSSERLPRFMPLPKSALQIPYPSVQAHGTGGERGVQVDRGVLHFFIADGGGVKKPTLEQLEERVFFPFIARETALLRETRGWNYRQFAVLVRDRKQALRLAGYLDRVGIPHRTQRGASLFESPAHQGLVDLMRAVLRPQERGAMGAAAGSPLMGWSAEELRNPASMPFIALFLQRLRLRLFERGFAPFFHALLRAVCKPGGQTVQEQLLAREGGLELYRDLRQIADRVIDHQHLEWNGTEGIIPFLDRFHDWEENDDERVKRFQDPAAEGVHIVTLHFSKGLEFDVVFALGLINRTEWQEAWIASEREGERLMRPVEEASEQYRQHCEENDAEKMRQLYVALTRAKHQLYAPAILNVPSERLQLGEASPMDLLAAQLNQREAASHHLVYERIRKGELGAFLGFLEQEGEEWGITYSLDQEISPPLPVNRSMASLGTLHPPLPATVAPSSRRLTSFSLLKASHDQSPPKKLNPPHDFGVLRKTVHTLPAHSDTGIFIHRLLEKCPFWESQKWEEPDQALAFTAPFVQGSPFEGWESTLAALLFNALKTPLIPLSPDFHLARLKPSEMHREMPFVFSHRGSGGIEELKGGEGLVQGVIDLLFSWQERYYLVDWKSHWLGPELEAYAPSQLERAMHDHGYSLQADIYVEALRRYLPLVDPRPFEECFGGVFYLFIRGMQRDGSTGVHYTPPNAMGEFS